MPDLAPEIPLDVARWLVSDAGLEAIGRCDDALGNGAEVLAVVATRRRDGLDRDRAAAAVGAAQARRRARGRWTDADRLVFTRAGLEQASDPDVSAWRARRFGGAPVEDRAAGCGGDTLALAAAGSTVHATDRDPSRLVLLAHNAAVRGLEVTTATADALVQAPPAVGSVHVDPGRRDGSRRLRRLEDHRPSVPALLAHLAPVVAGDGLAVVLGPGVDPDDPALPTDAEVEFVQLGGQLMEAVVWTGRLRGRGTSATADGATPRRTATILPTAPGTEAVTWSRADRGPRLRVGPVGAFLVEVAPAAVRARLHDEVGATIGAHRVADRRALLTTDHPPPASPWWQARRVEAVLPAGARAVRRWLRTADPRPVEVVLHGLAVDPVAYRRELGSPPGGPDGYAIELVRGDTGGFAVVTRRWRGAGAASGRGQ